MFSKDMRITEVLSVFYGHRLSAAGEKHDYSGGVRDYELIFKYSGKNRITFGDRTFEEGGGAVRVLPVSGDSCIYTSETLEPGDCL